MGKTSTFQIAIISVFIILAVLAVLIFAGVIKLGSDSQTTSGAKGAVVLWGTYSKDKVSEIFANYNQAHQDYSVIYIQKDPSALGANLAEAIASGTGPDLIMLPQDQIFENRTKLYAIPYASLPVATFRNTYIQEGELYMLPEGVIGLPVSIDPLIMYYNRDLLEAAGYTQPPKTWNDLLATIPNLTKADPNGNLTQSALPFGIYSNLNNAKDILSMLLLQAGNPIVSVQTVAQGGSSTTPAAATFLSALSQNFGATVSPAEAVVNFFTQFSDPNKSTYTWNKSFTSARDQFVNGELAFYFGYASELPTLAAKNPNLNFDISKVPQAQGTKSEVTFGKMQAVAVVKASKNFATAFQVASDISSQSFAGNLTTALLTDAPVAPARRDLLVKAPSLAYGPILYSSAIIARGWLDPGSNFTNPIFQSMVDDVTRGASPSVTSVNDASSKLQLLLK